ncbi:hypothetical protein, partial [Campylobacter concisus]|uniref:hypothetical protein n=1 Tax=Campylobacter concisus TaxID=199 RepID=UPI001CA5848C
MATSDIAPPTAATAPNARPIKLRLSCFTALIYTTLTLPTNRVVYILVEARQFYKTNNCLQLSRITV